MTRRKRISGWHFIAEFFGCPANELLKSKTVKKHLLVTAKKAGFEVLGEKFHQFKPYGATGVVVLSSSHISAHTWPEYNYAALDVYSCAGKAKAEKAMKLLKKYFKPEKTEIKLVKRYS